MARHHFRTDGPRRLCRADHSGALPADARLLVPRYLPALPKDPFDATGQPIRYAPAQFGRPILYSIGANGVDDLALGKWKLPAIRIDVIRREPDYVFEL